ncbi:MAG: 50S ribosomal protein L7/L12 [Bacteroidetes bacterium]|nr:MAG: 50S ribosomal protein L7/L12 [Bacteroidota bacterium]
MNNQLSEFDKQLLELCRKGRTLEAVKRYTETTGAGLKESKDYIDRLMEKPYEPEPPDMSKLDERLLDLCRQGNKLEAVKQYRNATGQGLKESKDYVDQLAKAHGIEFKGGCFVATACFGDYDAPEVILLRQFRDKKLLTNTAGRLFVKIYYAISPPIARQLEKSGILKRFVRNCVLKPLVKRITGK